jgi:uncharacterized cysteine cluster protein YcgN (CxxCxxCC family)
MMRECGNCTKCCEGWLVANIFEHKIYKDNPCPYIDSDNCKCSIYNKKPLLCSDFKCAWLKEEHVFPLWMKPNLINQIIKKHVTNEYIYYEIVEAGSTIDTEILNWFMEQAAKGRMNIKYSINGLPHYVGDSYFCKSRPMIGNS